MKIPRDPKELAEIILERSPCAVKVGAVLADSYSVFAWGWNSAGASGLGEHAEVAALRRAGRERLAGSTLYVAARRGLPVPAKPCEACEPRIRKRIKRVVWRDRDGSWQTTLYP